MDSCKFLCQNMEYNGDNDVDFFWHRDKRNETKSYEQDRQGFLIKTSFWANQLKPKEARTDPA